MTYEEFLKEVKQLNLHWNGHNGLRCVKGDCPIIALYKAKGHTDHAVNWHWARAANELKIEHETARKIIILADEKPEQLFQEINNAK